MSSDTSDATAAAAGAPAPKRAVKILIINGFAERDGACLAAFYEGLVLTVSPETLEHMKSTARPFFQLNGIPIFDVVGTASYETNSEFYRTYLEPHYDTTGGRKKDAAWLREASGIVAMFMT
tara:strand:+ start:606 stop:971 length:366 start_codon:yes stop_codon:yes gene_type:complete